MKIEQLYTKCLAEAAYYIESEGEAVIIDPLREVQPYLDKLNENGAELKYIFETHFHADFVSGHVDLSKKTGVPIVYGPTAKTDYESIIAEDGQVFQLGKISFTVLHTPGHTPESVTYLLKDEQGKNTAIFTGDTLFLGDVGRPDLAIKGDLTQEDLAGMLYDSLREKIMPLEDEVMVYPAHGAGSSCGKSLSKETFGTLGEQKKTNYALDTQMSKDAFIKELTTGILPPPQYFPKNALLNKKGYESFDEVLQKGNQALDLNAFKQHAKNGALILDVRHQSEYCAGHIPGSVFIGLDGTFAMWVGALIEDLNQPIVLVVPEERAEETITRLSRVGYDNTLGYLKGGFQSWTENGEAIRSLESIDASEFYDQFEKNPEIHIVDVRKPGEHESSHIEKALNYPLDFIHQNEDELDKNQKHYIHCAGGYRSVIASSILMNLGYEQLVDIQGGFGAIKNSGFKNKLVEKTCASA